MANDSVMVTVTCPDCGQARPARRAIRSGGNPSPGRRQADEAGRTRPRRTPRRVSARTCARCGWIARPGTRRPATSRPSRALAPIRGRSGSALDSSTRTVAGLCPPVSNMLSIHGKRA
jgi:hypothetical protein